MCYPFFVNEAAYYEKGVAVVLARSVTHEYRVLSAKKQASPRKRKSEAVPEEGR